LVAQVGSTAPETLVQLIFIKSYLIGFAFKNRTLSAITTLTYVQGHPKSLGTIDLP